VTYPPPAPASGTTWYDAEAVKASLFSRLRLLVDDVDAQRVASTVTAAAAVVEQFIDAETLWTDTALYTEGLIVVATAMYQGVDPEAADPWGLWHYLGRYKSRFGVS
jgi:hypothetical protein